MTKEITKAFILQQMQDKLGLRELVPEKFAFSEEVLPVYNIEQHLNEWGSTHTTKSITSGPAGYSFFTVPQTERWHLAGYNIVFMAAGAYKVTGMYTTRVGGSIIYLDMTEGQTVSYAVNLPKLCVLNAGDILSIYVDDYTSTADLRLYIDYVREEIR